MSDIPQTIDELFAKSQSVTCVVCKTRQATENWTSDGMMAFLHGMYERRCRRCCVEEQLATARKMAAQIPQLEAELETLP